MSQRTFETDKQRWERKFRASGAAIVVTRLSPPAMAALTALCEEFGCNRKDVIEGLLLGTIRQSATHTGITTAMDTFGATREEAAAMLPKVPRGTRP